MSTHSNAVADSSPDLQPVAAAPLAATRPFYWSVRRELWEHRSLVIAPLIAAAVVLFGFTIGTLHPPRSVHVAFAGFDAAKRAQLAVLPYYFAAVAIILTVFIVGVFYCLGALHNERRDRSILFWKSLPVSDLTTVLAKASIPLAVLPPVAFAIIVCTQLVMLLLSGVVLLASGSGANTLTTHVPMIQMSLGLIYTLVAIALWHAPIYGWLLLVSGWARRAAFLWAVLPPLALMLIEQLAFDTSRVYELLKYRLVGVFEEAFDVAKSVNGKPGFGAEPHIDPMKFFSTPGLWIGLVVAAGFVAASIWLRRYREPI